MTIYYSANTKGFYDTSVHEYPNLPFDKIEITREEYVNFLSEMNSNNKLLVLTDIGNLSLLDNVVELTWDEIRIKRTRLLRDSDYTQVLDYPGDKIAWATYRQTLRDIPQTYATPESVAFPNQPQ